MERMTGDEIRATNFALARKGYDVREVNGWLLDVATCLDAEARPPEQSPGKLPLLRVRAQRD